MAELIISQDEVIGIKKEIEEGSLELIFNALQSDIYSFPVKSFIRETISNGLDSLIEKDVFKKINAGEPVENYYLQRQDGALLKDSEYQPDYYDTEFLSVENQVTVEYIEDSPRDRVIIKDNGVGLGGHRLKMYFKIGASSKRNFLTARGLYGLGSKAALATGVDYFTMTTVYNGYKTSFMIYNRDYENITPETPGGKTEVWQVTMANNSIINKNIYWEKCDAYNSVTIEVEAKKHNKAAYINAVKDQFQYFGGKVKFTHPDINTSIVVTDYLNEAPEFESDNLVIPKYSTYSAPHILVDGISYGLIAWNELELESRIGKIALKVTANQVDITQSRESLKWTDKTKATILKAISLAEDEASEYVRGTMSVGDASNIFTVNNMQNTISSTNSSVIQAFSRFLQLHTIKPKFTVVLPSEDQIISILDSELFDFIFYSYDLKLVQTYTENKKLKIKAETVRTFEEIANRKIVFSKDISLGPKLANHVLNMYNTSYFIYIRENTTRVKEFISKQKDGKLHDVKLVKQYTEKLLEHADLLLDTLDVNYDETVLEEAVELEETAINLAKIRKLNKEIMWYEYAFTHYTYEYNIGEVPIISRDKYEYKISSLEDINKDKEVIVVPTEYLKLGKMLVMLEAIKPSKKKLRIVFVSEENTKHFMSLGGTHITNYFRQLNTETGELMIGEKLVELNTAYQFQLLKEQYSVFSDESNIISKISSIDLDKYNKLCIRKGTSIKDIMMHSANKDMELVEEILVYLTTLAEFQDVISTTDKEAIANKALELFGTDKIHNVYGYDKDYIDSVRAELEYISPVGKLIADLNGNPSEKSFELLKILLTAIHKDAN